MSFEDDDVAAALALVGPGESITIDGKHAARLRRALAIAQAVDEACRFRDMKAAVAHSFKSRAEELLRGKK